MELSKDTDVVEIPQNNSVFPHISIVKIPRSNPGDLIKTPMTIIPKEGILSDPKTDEYERTFCPRTINTRNGQIENRKRNIRRLESTKPYHLRTRLEKQKADWHMDQEYIIHPIFDPCTMVLRMNATNGIYTTGTETPKGIVLLTQLWMIRNYGYPIIILQHLQWNNSVLKKIWHQYSILSQ